MSTKLLSFSLIAAISLPAALFAQDAPPAGEPNVKIEQPKGPDEDREKVRLTDGPAPELPAGTEDGTPPPPAPGVPEEDEKSQIPKSIEKMSDEDKQKLGGLLQDAASYLGGIRVQEAFEKLVEAESMAPDYAAIHNLLGAAHTKSRNFDKAAISFSRAVELNPKAFMSKFNLTEIHFVQGKFAEAEKEFRELLEINPKMPESTKALIEFKVLVCLLKQDDEKGAMVILDTYDFLDDHPGFYFGNAAVHFHKGEENKARAWMASANRVYPPQMNSIYIDSFIEIGWVENLQ
jgi:tetratricopeptide (TPR) repeat protein